MQCGDLERYLEAFLDGRLGRSRSAILRRHLAMCAGCRARIERLRQFERDMQRRFRSMRQDDSIWRGLELDLVAAGRGGAVPHLLALPRLLPAPAADPGQGRRPFAPRGGHPLLAAARRGGGGKARGSRLAGVVLIAMALGALYQLARAQLGPADEPSPDAVGRAYEALARPERALALQTRDSRRIEAWLSGELGVPVALPATPAGYEPVGADGAALPEGAAGAVVYRDLDAGAAAGGPAPVVLFVGPKGGAPAAEPETWRSAAGRSELVWSRTPLRYTLVGDQPVEELRRFVGPTAAPVAAAAQ